MGRIGLLATAGLLLLPATAWAQEAVGVGEVVVTAQKREQRLSDVPISVAVHNEQALESVGVTRPADLNQITPGLNINQSLANSTPFLRGVGNTSVSQGDEAVVATYVDGVYMNSTSTSSVPFAFVERVEVLKGPQGTLFGRNATGGLISIITRDPSDELSIDAGLSVANYDTRIANFYITGPLAPGLTANFSFSKRQQNDGYVLNRTTGNHGVVEDYETYRAKLRFEPNAKFSALLMLDYYEINNTLAALRVAHPDSVPRPAVTHDAEYSTSRDYTYSPIDPFVRAKTFGASVRLDADLGVGDLVSITGYRTSSDYIASSTNLTSVDGISGVTTTFLSHQDDPYFYSQEFQFLSKKDGPFEWITGVFFQNSEGQYDPVEFYVNAAGAPAAGNYSSLKINTSAIFADGTYRFPNNFSLTVGARYTYEERSVAVQGLHGSASFAPIDQSESWTSPTWRVVLDYKPMPNTMVYASYNRGFKSGTFNPNQVNPALNLAVDPEQVDALELGFKWQSEGRRVGINGSTFYYDYTDIQVTARDPVTSASTLMNADGAEIYGIDLETRFQPWENMTLTANAAWLHARYTDFPNAVGFMPNPDPAIGGNSSVVLDASGNNLVRSPELTANIGFDQRLPTETLGTFGVNGNLYWSDEYFFDAFNRVPADAYSVLSGNLYWEPFDSNVRFSIWGRNLLDEEYLTFCSPAVIGDGCSYAAPRQVGATIDFHW